MTLSDFFFGKKEQFKNIPTMNPQQESRFGGMLSGQLGAQQDPLFQKAYGHLMDIFGGEGQDALSAPYMRQFQEEIMPMIAQRFAGMGGGLTSSAFGQAQVKGAESLAEKIAAMDMQRKDSALSQALPYTQLPFQQQQQLLGMSPFQTIGMPRQPGILESGLKGLLGTEAGTGGLLKGLTGIGRFLTGGMF